MIQDDQQNILSLDKNNSKSTQNEAAQNLLTQMKQDFLLSQELEIKQNSKQPDSYQNITLNSFDLTLTKSLKSQIGKVARNRLFTNALCKIINQENKQSVIISYQKNSSKSQELDQNDQSYQNNLKFLDQIQEECIKVSTSFQNNPTVKKLNPQNSSISTSIQKQKQKKSQQNPSQLDNWLAQSSDIQHQSGCQSQELVQMQVLLNSKENLQQNENSQQICSSKIDFISDKIVQNIKDQLSLQKEIKLNQSSFEQKKNQQEDILQLIKDEDIYRQQNLKYESNKLGQIQQEKKKSDDMRVQEAKQDAEKQQNIQLQENFKYPDNFPFDKNQQQKQEKSQDDIKNSQQKYQENSLEQILVIDEKNYKKILNQIYEYQFNEYEMQEQSEFYTDVGNFFERKFNEDTFNKINKNCIQNTHFEQMKNTIFNQLQQRNFYLCKLLSSNEKQDLFIGYEELDTLQYENELISIKYNMTQTEYKITEKMFEALKINCQIIDISINNTYVFILSVSDIEVIQDQIKLFNESLNKVLNYSSYKNYFEISFKDSDQYKKFQSQEKQIEFLLSFIKEQTYYMCEFNDKQVEGIMLNLIQQQIIQQLQNFVIYHIFNLSLKEDSFPQQNKMEQNQSYVIQQKKAMNTYHLINNNICLQDNTIQQENTPNQITKIESRINDNIEINSLNKDQKNPSLEKNIRQNQVDTQMNVLLETNNIQNSEILKLNINQTDIKNIPQLVEEYNFKEFLIEEIQPIFYKEDLSIQ
ncbi:hypothetical protein ABPG74_019308 [Tetrahymena malaccensis]